MVEDKIQVAVEIQPALEDHTGVGWYLYELLNNIDRSEIEIIGNYFNFLNRHDYRKSLSNLDLKYNKLQYVPYRIYKILTEKYNVSYNLFFRKKTDVYHFTRYILPNNIKGKVILNIYDLVFEKYVETMESKNRESFKRSFYKSVKRADQIITISESSKNELVEILKVPENKIHIVQPGIDFQKFNTKNSEVTKNVILKYSLPEDYILYLGTLEPRKNISSIIRAYGSLRNNNKITEKLVIAGKKGWLFSEIFDLIKSLDLGNEVILTDYVDESDKPAIYQNAKLFVFPSLYEGFGMPILEAMAAGIPVITSNTSAMPEVAGDAAILVNPLSIEEMSEAMLEVMNNDKLSNELISKGFDRCKKFTWSNSANKLVEIYKKYGGK